MAWKTERGGGRVRPCQTESEGRGWMEQTERDDLAADGKEASALFSECSCLEAKPGVEWGRI